MKKFVYRVESFEFEDTEAFGTAWKEAKAKATELHAPIYRSVIDIQQQVYLSGGCFIGVDYAKDYNIKIF